MPLQPGSRLGPYEVLSVIGAGGMGEVWLATELRLGRKIALKLLPPDLTRDPVRIQRFEQEARAASALNHPNVCTIHALDQTSEGQHYIVMEYVEGETLRQRLTTSRLSIREAVEIGIQMASALTAAHAAGIVHRDIKPDNVMLRPDGLVKVLDFGLAKLAAHGPETAGADTTQVVARTDPGTIVGTVAYMSPEQARGQDVDARTDVWSLGATLYEMLTGRSPFAASSSTDVLAAILDREPAPLARFDPDVPAELQRITTKTLRKDREQRYQTVKDLLLDLRVLREDLASPARTGSGSIAPSTATSAASTSGQTVTANPATGRRRMVLATVAALLVVAAAVGTWVWRRARPAPTAAAPTIAAAQRNLTRVTFGPGLHTDVTWSPDGTRIAYTSDRSGNFDIWSQTIAGGDAVQLTKAVASDTQPAWSPDGRSIAFRSERDGGGVFVVPAFGGPERQLTSFGLHPQWSASGAEITFNVVGAGRPTTVYGVAAAGGEPPRELLREFVRGGMWDWIAFHPDGRLSAIGLRQGAYGFFTVSRSDGRVTTSSIPPTLPLAAERGTRVVQFQWNREGTALFVVATVNEVRNLWKVRVEPRTLAWLSAERLTTGIGADVNAALSSDGSRLAFTTQRASVRLWVYPFDAVAGRLTGAGRPVTPEEGEVTSWDLSPDGRQIAYALQRPGSDRTDLWLTEVDSGARGVLAQNGLRPVWSPNGKSIAYNLIRPDRPPPGEWALAMRELDGAERVIRAWSTTSLLVPFDWTRDGNAILASSVSLDLTGHARLVLWPRENMPATTPERVVVERAGTNLWQGRYSPDGRWLSFSVQPLDERARVQLAVVPSTGGAGGEWTPIAPEHRWADKPRWAPDGRTIYFLSAHGSSFFNLWGIRFDVARGTPVGEPFKITHFAAPGFALVSDMVQTELGISARRALLAMASVTGDIWILDNVDK